MNAGVKVEYVTYSPPEPGRYRGLVAEVDAAAHPNPGNGGCAVVFFAEGGSEPVGTVSVYLGNDVSSNIAEIFGVLLAYLEAANAGAEKLVILTDNQFVSRLARGEEREALSRALQDPVAALDKYSRGVPASEVRWVPRTAVSHAHERARETIQGRAWVDRPKSGARLVLDEILPALEACAPLTISTPFVYTARGTVWMVPFYSFTPEGAVPSVERRHWERAVKLARNSGNVLLAWRPYGNKPDPLVTERVHPSLRGGAQRGELARLVAADVTGLSLGERTGRVGYSGTEVHLLTSGFWMTLEEALRAWQAPRPT